MDTEWLRQLPERPLSEVEWEDLLLRLELMPRALRVTLENLPIDDAILQGVLERALKREEAAADFMDRAVAPGYSLVPPGPRSAQIVARQDDRVERFVRIRSRTFAMAQRRGIEIWDWSAPVWPTGRATIHQVLAYLAAEDVRVLAELRDHSRTSLRVC
jgi:hypothetical protein